MTTTFAALGDSITLGIGDPVRKEGERRRGGLSQGRAWRGWAALLAGGLLEPRLHVLASCGARATDVERDQLPAALQVRPDIASFVVGVNDTLRANFDIDQVATSAAHTVGALRAAGVTIILTTHYIEEAEEMADRVGVINKGELIVVEDKAELMRKLGRKQLILELRERLGALPEALAGHGLTLSADGMQLVYTYDTKAETTGITTLLDAVRNAGVRFKDLQTRQSSLEDIFVGLVRQR